MRVIAFALVILAATAIAAGVKPSGRYCTLFESKAVSLVFTESTASVAYAAADDWSTYVYTYATTDSLATFYSSSTSEYYRNQYTASSAYAVDNNTVMLFGSNQALRLTKDECNMTTAYDGQYCGFRNGSPYELTISANTYQMVFSGKTSCTATGMIYNGMMSEETLSCPFYTHKFTMAGDNIKMTATDTSNRYGQNYYELVANKSECGKFDSFAQDEYCGKDENDKALSLTVSDNTFVMKGDNCRTSYGGFSLTGTTAKIMLVPQTNTYYTYCIPNDATATYSSADGFAFTSATKKMTMKIGNCNTSAIPNGVYCYLKSSSNPWFGKLVVSGSKYTKTVVTPGKAASFNGFTTTEATTMGTFAVAADKKISTSNEGEMTKWDATTKTITVDGEEATMAICGGSIADATYCGIDKDNEPVTLWTIGSNSIALATDRSTYTGVYSNNFTEIETSWNSPSIEYDAGNDVFQWNEKTNLTVSACSNMFSVTAGSYCGVLKGVFYNATVSGLQIYETTLKINGSVMGASEFTETSLGAGFDYAFDNITNALNITSSSTTYELTAENCKMNKVIPDGAYSGLAADGKTPVAALIAGRAISFTYGSDDSDEVCRSSGAYTRGTGTDVELSVVAPYTTYNCNLTFGLSMMFSGSSIRVTAMNNVTNMTAVLSMPSAMPGKTIPDGMYCNYEGKVIAVSGSKMTQAPWSAACTDESFYYMAVAPSADDVTSTIRIAKYKSSCQGVTHRSASYSYYGGITLGSADTYTTYKCGGGASLQRFSLNTRANADCNTSTGIYPSSQGTLGADDDNKMRNGSYCDQNNMNTAIVVNGENITVPTFGYAKCGFSAGSYTYIYSNNDVTLSDYSTPDSCPIILGRGDYVRYYNSGSRYTVSGVYGTSYNATLVGFAVNTSIIGDKEDLFSLLKTSLSLGSSDNFLLINVTKQVIDSKNATVYLVQFVTPTQSNASVALAVDQKLGGITGASAIGGSSAPAPAPTANDEKKDDKKPLGLYVGAAVGAIAFLAIVIVAIKFATAPKAAPAGGDDYRPMNAVTNV